MSALSRGAPKIMPHHERGSICDEDAVLQRKEFARREFIRRCLVRVHRRPEDLLGVLICKAFGFKPNDQYDL
jgi:hypothetical protein